MEQNMVSNKPPVITLSGEPGTGTTTIAKLLSDQLKIPLTYIGETFRELAKEHNMGLSEFSSYAESHPAIDRELDKRQLNNAREGNVILEGRLSGWLVKSNGIDGFTVLLTADIDTRVRRIMGREGKDIEQVKAEIQAREACEQDRYQEFYNVNYLDHNHYDLIIDTSELNPEQIVQRIINLIKNREK